MFTGRIDNEPEAEYHAKREHVSSSPLPEMAKSPQHFFYSWKRESFDPTADMDKGDFIHKILLEQDIKKFARRPTNEKGELVRSNSKEYAAFLANIGDKTPIHPDLYDEALSVLTAACNNRKFLKAFEASDKEVSFYGVHESTGLPIKARPDMIAKDYSFILEVKSTSDILRFEKQIFNLGYDVRLVHYVETIRAVTGKDVPEIYFYAIESRAPYGAKMFRLSKSSVEAATSQWMRWMNEISVCAADDKWPGFDEVIADVDRPAYLEVETVVSFEGVG